MTFTESIASSGGSFPLQEAAPAISCFAVSTLAVTGSRRCTIASRVDLQSLPTLHGKSRVASILPELYQGIGMGLTFVSIPRRPGRGTTGPVATML
jgi:hypothetical protein